MTSTTLHDADGIQLIQGECLQTLQGMAARGETFDALLTDPPYASGGLHLGTKSQPTNVKYQQNSTERRHADFSGDARDQFSWMTWCAIWLNACRSMLKPGSPVMMFCDWRQIGAAVNSLQNGGFVYRGVVVWEKSCARPMGGRFRAQCEYIVWGSVGSMPLRNLYLPGIFKHAIPTGAKRKHASQKPVPLLSDLLQIVPDGGRVLDPFAGSASTLIAARSRGLQAVGIEESAEIAANAVDNLRGQE